MPMGDSGDHLLTSYAGVRCQQNIHAFTAFRAFFQAETFPLIIELGSGSGAFTQFLAAETAAQVFSWNLHVPNWPPRERLEYRKGDVFSLNVAYEVAQLVAASERALILCDDGNKPAEFAKYAPLLRPGDVIMVHDYASSREQFDADMRGRHWDWLECTDADLRGPIADGLEPYCPGLFALAAWGCFRKPGT